MSTNYIHKKSVWPKQRVSSVPNESAQVLRAADVRKAAGPMGQERTLRRQLGASSRNREARVGLGQRGSIA